MTIEEFAEEFENDDDYGKFEKVCNKLSSRPDLHAFLLLDRLMPTRNYDIVDGAAHDMIFLDPNVEHLAEVITKEQIAELIQCGVIYDDDCLCMYV